MKSYINVLADYHEAPLEKNVVIRCPEEHIQAQMKHLTRNYKRTEPVQTIEKGDVAVLSLESGLEKFNRPMIPLTVGKNLFDAELEEQLLGHNAGETFTVTVQENDVTVTIKQASRTIFPEPTDEMAASYAKEHDEFSEVKTVEEYRRHVKEQYLNEQRQQILYQSMDDVLNYVLTHSDWEFSEEDINERMEEAKKDIREQLNEEGKELETLTEEELQMNFGVSSLEEFEKLLLNSMEQSIASDLWLMAVHGKSSIEEMEEYPWGFLETFVKETLNITEEK